MVEFKVDSILDSTLDSVVDSSVLGIAEEEVD